MFGFLRFILSFMATGMLHSYGRRSLCIFSAIAMGITLFISGLCIYLRTIGNLYFIFFQVIFLIFTYLCIIYHTTLCYTSLW